MLRYERLPNETQRSWDNNGKLINEFIPEIHRNNNNILSQEEINALLNSGEIYNQPTAQNTQDTKVHSLLDKYANILNSANPYNINPSNLLRGSLGFTTPDVIEKYYQQDVTHATGHIITNNRFSLDYLLSGEGSNSLGAGIYFEESPEVAEFYRRFGLPNRGLGTLHVHFNNGYTYSAPDYDKWDNSPSAVVREVLNDIQATIFDNPDASEQSVKDRVKAGYSLAIGSYGANSKRGNEAQEAIKILDNISHWEFSPDENFGKKGNIYRTSIPDNDVLLNWDALLDEQPEHVKNAIDKIMTFIDRFADDYELDTDTAWEYAHDHSDGKTIENSGGEFYEFVSNIMEQYLNTNTPDDGIDNPQLRASLLLLNFGIPGHRYWDNNSRFNIHAKYDKYRKNNPHLDGREATSVAITSDGQSFTGKGNNWSPIWNNNPNEALSNVLTDIHREFSSYGGENSLFQDVKNNLASKYLREIKRAKASAEYGATQEEVQEEIDRINDKINALNSISSFTYYPAIKPTPYSPFSVFGSEGTRNFVIWDEDLMHIIGLTPDSDKEAIDYFNNYKDEHPDSFITPDALERFDQLVTHATGNIIWNNRFDLRYAGSSEGGAAFGFGAYFEQNPAVAQSYRRYGLPKGSEGIIHILTSDGQEFIGNDFHAAEDNPLWLATLNDVYKAIKDNPDWDWDNIKASIKKEYKLFMDTQRNTLHARKTDAMLKSIAKKSIEATSKKLNLLDSISSFNIEGRLRGNIYQFDIPENYELLDWDAPLDEQPDNVKKAIRKIFNSLKRRGFLKDDILNNPEGADIFGNARSYNTGEDFYWGIVRAFEYIDKFPSEDLYGLKRKGIKRSDARASWLLNKYGIPGHRFLDEGSRDNGYGTHNFVIWNMDRVTMTGISDDSDELARKTFYNGGQQQLRLFDDNGNPNETYHQIIGLKGAINLDHRNGNSWLSDNLHIAQKMTQAGKDALTIRAATGWENGYDGEWKYEIQDGNIYLPRNLRMALLRNSGKLPYSIKLKHL